MLPWPQGGDPVVGDIDRARDMAGAVFARRSHVDDQWTAGRCQSRLQGMRRDCRARGMAGTGQENAENERTETGNGGHGRISCAVGDAGKSEGADYGARATLALSDIKVGESGVAGAAIAGTTWQPRFAQRLPWPAIVGHVEVPDRGRVDVAPVGTGISLADIATVASQPWMNVDFRSHVESG